MLLQDVNEPYFLNNGYDFYLFQHDKETLCSAFEVLSPYATFQLKCITTDMAYDSQKMPASKKVTAYGANGQSKTKTSATNYDSYGDLTLQIDPLGRKTVYEYDAGTPAASITICLKR